MKKTILGVMSICSIIIMSCNSNNDTTTSSGNDTLHADTKMTETPAPAKMDSASGTNTNPNAASGANDADFAMTVADGGMLEVKLGKLGQMNSSSKEVKDLSKMLVDQHAKANKDLMAAAKKNNIDLPADISAESKKKYDDMAAKKGADFDKAYTDLLKDEHAKTISKLENEIATGSNADIKAWAAATLPVIKEHNAMILKTYDNVRKQ